MHHQIPAADIKFLQLFESCQLLAAAFHHREHIRLAYILLVLNEPDLAHTRLKTGLLKFLLFNKVDSSKYHETLTFAWLLAVKHFMHQTNRTANAGEFIKANSALLNKDIMYTHYSHELINSTAARKTFIAPDLEVIPTY